MLEADVETALFLEDDVDWEYDIRKALVSLQEPLVQIQNKAGRSNDFYRYDPNKVFQGDWDMLWFGVCIESPWKASNSNEKSFEGMSDDLTFVAYPDPTLDGLHAGKEMWAMFKHYNIPMYTSSFDTGVEEKQRVIQLSRTPVCMMSYALSRKGAAKLFYLATREVKNPVDEMARKASENGFIESYSIVPGLMGQWKVKNGDTWYNSDIEDHKRSAPREAVNPSKGGSYNVGPGSVRSGLHRYLREKYDTHRL